MTDNEKYKFLAGQMLEILYLIQKDYFSNEDYQYSCDIRNRLNNFIDELNKEQ